MGGESVIWIRTLSRKPVCGILVLMLLASRKICSGS